MAIKTREEQQPSLQALFDDMHTLVALLDINGAFTFVNNTPLQLLGLSQEDVLGTKIWASPWFAYSPTTQNLIQSLISRAANGEAFLEEIQIQTSNGLTWVEFSIHAVYDAKGKISKLVAEARDISGRHKIAQDHEQALEALKSSEQNLALTLNNIGEGIIATDTKGNVTWMNPVAEKLLAHDRGEAWGQTLQTILPLIHTITGLPLENPFAKTLSTGETTRLSEQLTLLNRVGSKTEIEIVASPIRDRKQEVQGMVITINDMTETYLLRQKAFKNQQRIEQLLDDVQTLLGILEPDGTVTFLNTSPLQMAGIQPEEIIGKKLWDGPWFEDDTETQNEVRGYLQRASAGNVVRGDLKVKTLAGTIWIEFNVHPIPDESGTVVELFVEGRDPSARRNVEAEREKALRDLQDREQNLAITLDSIGDAVITTDKDGLITRMNPIAEKLTGWLIEEAQGQVVNDIFPIINATTREPLDNPIEKIMATGEIVYLSNHTTLVARDNQEYQIADSAAPIRDSEGEIQGMVLVFNDVTEQYRLREQARETQAQMQRLFNDMETMLGILDTDGTLTFLNNTPLIAAGLSSDDVLGRKFWDTPWLNYDPDLQTIVKNAVATAAQGEAISVDLQFQSAIGLLWADMRIHPVVNDEGKVIQVVVEGREISARKKMEDELRASQQHLTHYRNQAPLAAIEWNTVGEIVGWNQAAEQIFGYTFDEIKEQRPFEFLVQQKDITDMEHLWVDLMKGTGGERSVNENRTKDGRTIICEWHNTAIRGESGEIVGVASIVLDITAQRAAQQALLDSEAEQREILDSMADSVVSFNEAGEILSFNKAAEGIFGYTAEEIIGRSISQLLTKPWSTGIQENMKFLEETGKLRPLDLGANVYAKRKNNDTFPTHISVTQLGKTTDGKSRFIGTCQDLTESRQKEEQLRRSQKMDALGKLTGGIAHDFNNMLGVISGYADLLAEAVSDQPGLAKYAHEIRRAGERGAKLTEKLLSFTRAKTADGGVVDINKLLIEQLHMLERSLTPRIKIVHDLGEELWPVYLDDGDLEDAMINISINAMHAMESGGTLTIQTRNIHLDDNDARLKGIVEGDYIRLSIADTGMGMDPATKEKVFDPFFSTKGDKGTGLGLSQVYGFMARSQGSIEVSSEPGKGTDFSLYFPRYHVQDNAKQAQETSQEINLSGSETVLIVDDETALLDLCFEILSTEGYRVICAESGKQALKLLENTPVDLLFSDVIMPDMDGYQLSAIVQEKYPEVKIQMTSGFSDERHAGISDESLHKSLLSKPYRAQTLLTTVRELLDRRRI